MKNNLIKNCYDLICVGRNSQKVAKLIQQQHPSLVMSKLIINSQIQKPQKANRKQYFDTSMNFNYLTYSGVKKVDHKNNSITLFNGEVLRFKYLVYSGSDSEWKNTEYFSGLKSSLDRKYSSIFADIKEQDQFYDLDGKMVFGIPKQPNFAYRKLNFLKLLYSKLQNPESRIIIINQGNNLFPECQDPWLNERLKQIEIEMMAKFSEDKLIEIVNNSKISHISSFTRKVYGQFGSLNFHNFFQFLPFKQSEVIDLSPKESNEQTLQNLENSSIYLIGNDPFSLQSEYSLFIKRRIIAHNIFNRFIGSDKMLKYNNQNMIAFNHNYYRGQLFYLNKSGKVNLERISDNMLIYQLYRLTRFAGERKFDHFINNSFRKMFEWNSAVSKPKIFL